MAETTTISLNDIDGFKQNALHWANQFRVVCLLTNNNYPDNKYPGKEWVLAVDAIDETGFDDYSLDELKRFHNHSYSTIFGFITYDVKNQIERLQSNNYDGLHFPELYFFKPRYVLELNGNKLTVNRNYPETFELLEAIKKFKPSSSINAALQLKCRTGKQTYLQNVDKIREQIAAGDFYEMNYCVEFNSENARINAVATFLKLNAKAQAPFSSLIKYHDKYLLCASPERFLKKDGDKLISQPIKGTIHKGQTAEENERLKTQLQEDIKERAENVMIVDLVRNDLAKCSEAGTVKVEELFGIYEFNTVNQMISTVTSKAKTEIPFTDILKSTFPMGSMTGAPKVMVMETIEQYEDFKRGLYSGAVGYITPEGNFDFNVVIRSILYNETAQYLSVPVGGAITYDSVAEKEYEEVLLKAQATIEVLSATD
ncbi:MAG: anthranilate synthase component I family protein [Chitinophagales bacterium]